MKRDNGGTTKHFSRKQGTDISSDSRGDNRGLLIKEVYERQQRIDKAKQLQKKQSRAKTNVYREPHTEPVVLIGGGIIYAHREDMCRGYWCPIHNVSPHHMRRWIQEWCAHTKSMMRVCKCGVQHPDPDDRQIPDHDPAKCCGCCDRRSAVSRPSSATGGSSPIAGPNTA